MYRDYPLANHSLAGPAAEAGMCAHDQGKFWAYHDKLYQNQGALSPDDLKSHAAEIGLDTEAFGACFDSGKFRDAVQQDFRDAQALGVTGTPAFFVNGRFISGAQPFEAFQVIIDEELAR